ncbi:MAG TPA: acyl-CoA dehydrogenase [Streptosporangiaceae bacterium]|nr:acyl-CoA dehydrogenase [Streptosporangiaceae bacterium]
MPIAFTEEQRAIQDSIRDWAGRTGPQSLVRGLEPAGHGTGAGASSTPLTSQCWDELAGLGIFGIAAPPAVGGADGSVADLAAALEGLGYVLAPGPVMPTVLAGLVLAGHAEEPAARALLPGLVSGKSPAAVAFGNGALRGVWEDGGTLRVTGETGPVLGAGATTHLLLPAATDTGEVWFLATPGQPGATVIPRQPVDFSRPLATIRLTDAPVAASALLRGVRTGAVRDLAATLSGAEAAAVARWCCDTAASYARTRHQFGRPIGSFQAVKHMCAWMLCRAETAAALAWDAARVVDEAPQEHPLAAAAAAASALDAAVDNAKDCIQVLGGIGFTWEHDAHLYLRRALALRALLGGSAQWRARTAALALAGSRRHLSVDRTGAGGDDAAHDAREVASRIASLPVPSQRAALADAGYAAPQWPPPYGLAASPAAQHAIDEELHRAGLSRPDLVIGGWAVPAVIAHGNAEQAARFAGPTLRGEVTWCQLFSEPEAGSDLAGLRTRAEPADGGWRLTGQKVWTSLAHEADWAICLARTDPDAPKHRGLTFFLVDMTSDGIEIRPLREITGRAVFNEVFLDGVFVPGDCVVGRPGEGWRIARSALATERVAMGQGSALSDEVEGLINAVTGAGLADDPRVADQVGGLVADGLAGSLLDLRTALAQLHGQDPGPAAAVRKLAGVAHRQAVAQAVLDLYGPDAAATDGVAEQAVHDFLLTRCLSIAGGTTQVLLSVVGEHALGLPREPAAVTEAPAGKPAGASTR